MPGNAVLKAIGLNTHANQLEVPEGSLTVASNVIIERDNVLQPRRGFRLYGTQLGTESDRVKQFLTYKNRIIRHFAESLEFDTQELNNSDESIFESFAGDYSEPEAGRRIRSIEANQNLYFTSSEGIKKISATSADAFSTDAGYITQAGQVKAVDLEARLKVTLGQTTGFFTQDSAVAYRIVWGSKDANNNLSPGTPSQRTEIYNPLLTLLLNDYLNVLGALDDIAAAVTADTNLAGSLIDNKNYVNTLKLLASASASSLNTNLSSLASKIDNDIVYANSTASAPLQLGAGSAVIAGSVCTVTFSSGNATNYFTTGSLIFLAGYTPAAGTINGAQTVTGVTATTITFNTAASGLVSQSSPTIVSNTFRSITAPSAPSTPATHTQLVAIQTYLTSIISALQALNSNVIGVTPSTTYIIPLAVTTTASVYLDITIPDGITIDHFYQVYRSSVAEATGASVLSTDVFPSDELQQVYEAFPSQAEIDAGTLTIEDIVLDTFRGASLYTNAQSGEGILQANDLPPFALDINRFKNTIFYANTRTHHKLNLSLLGVSNMIADYDAGTTPKVVITDGDYSNTYSFVTGRQEVTTVACVGGTSLAASGTASYFLLYNANSETAYYVWYKIGTATDPAISGKTGIQVLAGAADSATTIAEKTRDALNRHILDFSASNSTITVTITNIDDGYTTDASAGTSGFTVTVTTQGRGEKITQEITSLGCAAGSSLNIIGAANYFTLNTPFDRPQYYVWYQVGTSTDPAVSGKTGIRVTADAADTAAQIATKTAAAIAALDTVFTATALSTTVTITTVNQGPCTDAAVGTLPGGFTISITQQGALEVLLSSDISPAQAVDETARSLVSLINRNKTEGVYAYYLSGAQDVPGKINIEARTLSIDAFHLLGNNSNTGESFSPDLSPTNTITGISAANPTVITSATHGLTSEDQIVIVNSNSSPNVDGVYTITNTGTNTFTIPLQVTNAGNIGAWINVDEAVTSENEMKPHRIYYSKLSQPEAVPIVNYLDVGSENKQILRIFPLRDSLFVFKEDGLYRISGEVAPFNVALFDSSCVLLAPDSLDTSNNLLFAWTERGIEAISESGVTLISKEIDVTIKKLASSNYPGFATATWGVGYDSDNAYLVATVVDTTDEQAEIIYRYSTLTSSWTTFDLSATAGIINPADKKLYLGAGDTNKIAQERKTFSRLDYTDRELVTTITLINPLTDGSQNYYIAENIEVEPGDVITQDQLVTIYGYNALLQKLDLDPGVTDANYYSLLEAESGDDLRQKLVNATIGLAPKLDADAGLNLTNYLSSIASQTGTITGITATNPSVITTSVAHGLQTGRIVTISGSNSTPSINGEWEVTVLSTTTFSIDTSVTVVGTTGTFVTDDNDVRDIEACYNFIIANLNADTGTVFKNYTPSEGTTTQEAIVQDYNSGTKIITVDEDLPFVLGDVTIFKAIESTIVYTPNTMKGDPLSYKHIRAAQVFFENTAFTEAMLSFATDLFPAFVEVTVPGSGNGMFGSNEFGEGFFGGAGNQAPFRTYIPRQCMRCRFVVVKFSHKIAREFYSLFGHSLIGEVGQSDRAYRR